MKTAVKSSNPTARPTFSRTDRRLAITLFALSLGIYSRTLAPGLLFGDPGEFQFAAWRFGLAHPTGYPFYLLLGGMWQRLTALFGADPAFSLNLFSGLVAAGAVAVFYLAVLAWLPRRDAPARIAAAFAALLIAVNPTFWSQALIAEVYALHALFIAAFLLLTGRHSQSPLPFSPSPLLPLSLLLGLALTHHRTSLFLLPGFLLWLLWRQNQNADSTDFADFRRFLSVLIRPIPSTGSGHRRVIRVLSPRQWAAIVAGLALPQLLYLYVPLRSGPDASPWLYPRLGDETLALYTPTFQGFIEFVTGSVFAVSFLSPAQALARIPEAANLWLVHFTWPGLALAAFGLLFLLRGAISRQDSNADSAEDADSTDEIRVPFDPRIQKSTRHKSGSLLLLTLPAFALLQVFNLFYGIGDIYVFYIPLYLIAGLWAACGVALLVRGRQTTDESPDTRYPIRNTQYALWFLLLFTLPVSLFITHLPAIDRSGDDSARRMWDAILAAPPPDDAILVSNDRNEIVPLYYVQAVEGRAAGVTGLFPLLTPEERFADVAAVTETALAGGERPVYLVKEMPGLGVKFAMAQATPPLVRVLAPVAEGAPEDRLDLAYGPLTLLGYRVDATADGQELSLFWRVDETPGADYTTSVQLFDAGGNRLAQDDRPPGGLYYATSQWKPGEILRDSHPLPPAAWDSAARLQVLLYTRAGEELIHLAPALTVLLP